MLPRLVYASTALAPRLLAISAADAHSSSDTLSSGASPSLGSTAAPNFSSRPHCSIRPATERRTARALAGWAPIADSPESIRASARWRTTSATSATFSLLFLLFLLCFGGVGVVVGVWGCVFQRC